MNIFNGKIAPGEVLPTEAGLGASLMSVGQPFARLSRFSLQRGWSRFAGKPLGAACAPGSIGNYLKQLKGCEPVRAPKTLLLPTARRSPAVFVWCMAFGTMLRIRSSPLVAIPPACSAINASGFAS